MATRGISSGHNVDVGSCLELTVIVACESTLAWACANCVSVLDVLVDGRTGYSGCEKQALGALFSV